MKAARAPRRLTSLALALLLGSGSGAAALAHAPWDSPSAQTAGTADDRAASAALPAAGVVVDVADRPGVLQAVDALQYAHRFAEAEALLSRRLALEPDDGEALLQRSQLRIAVGNARGALADCIRAAPALDALTASACAAQAEAALGRVVEARRIVDAALARAVAAPPLAWPRVDGPIQSLGWAQGIAAELADRVGDAEAAERWHLAAVKNADGRHFPQLAYAEFLVAQQRPRAALDLLATAGDGESVVDMRRRALQPMAGQPSNGAAGDRVSAPLAETSGPAAFFVLGIEHLLTGYDHLAFLALLLLGTAGARGSRWDAARVVTAFTLAHSLTLALAVGGWVRLPAAPVEASIAASIVATAGLLLWAVLRRRPSIAGHWGLAFGFGLLHGLGFANVLVESLQGSSLAVALLAFNLGLETAQIGLLLLSLPAILWLARSPALARPTTAFLAAGIGLLGFGWLAERLA